MIWSIKNSIFYMSLDAWNLATPSKQLIKDVKTIYKIIGTIMNKALIWLFTLWSVSWTNAIFVRFLTWIFCLVLQLKKMLELLVHASQCRSQHCQYPNCRKVKGLFRHGMLCKVRASGGCPLCKKMWYLLQLHSRACKESVCTVPRCRCVLKPTTFIYLNWVGLI